jgi:glucose-6-phosphate dehydrogenase assembly protein OpcA
VTDHGCHDCTHRAAPQLCAAPTPRPTWAEALGNWNGRVCPAHEPRGRAPKRYPAEVLRAAVEDVTLGWPQELRSLAWRRVTAGAQEHPKDDVAKLDVAGEALEEALDVGGYAGLARLTGRWSWRWALAVLLAGWIARLMMAERGRVA